MKLCLSLHSQLVMNEQEKYLHRCLELATQGFGKVSPNPMVGAVLVHNHQIIGEGFHQQFGGPHAEVNAIASVKDNEKLAGATLYVNLEPCSHHGKTPPCTDLIISSGIKKVVIGSLDTNPHVKGKGVTVLNQAGIETVCGVLEEECRQLNKRFYTFHEKQRPYIILKWAQSADGFISDANSSTASKISNEISNTLVHKWRSEEDAIMVGTQTAVADNPRLDVRLWKGKNPLRITIDRTGRIPSTHHLLDKSIPTLVFTAIEKKSVPGLEYLRIDRELFDDPVPSMVYALYLKEISSLLVEGGTKTIELFFRHNLWDEIRVITASKKFGAGTKAPEIKGNLQEQFMAGNDEIKIYRK